MLPLNSEQKALGLRQIQLKERLNFPHGFEDLNDIQFFVKILFGVTIYLVSFENPRAIALPEYLSVLENPRKDEVYMSLFQFFADFVRFLHVSIPISLRVIAELVTQLSAVSNAISFHEK